MDARKRGMILQNAPQVLFRNDPPLELEGVPGVNNANEGEMSYVTFGIASSRLDFRLIANCAQSFSLVT